MKRFLLIWMGVCQWIFSNAQEPHVLKGVVIETNSKGNLDPIQSAYVHWLGSNKPVLTDSNGVFSIPVPELPALLIVQAIGFTNDTILVNSSNYLKVVMVSKRSLKDAVITYERGSSEVSFIDPWKTTVMNQKELFKAACCNLSESFETNPSVDVAYSDALTGSKQIQMLGLGGQYTQITFEQVPGVRGIATNFGLSYLPGTWINSIQVSKGLGSVVNGFESVSGQINVELHKAISKDRLLFNAYIGQGGRAETNIVLAQQPSKMFSHALFIHGSSLYRRMDQNGDDYLDNPLGNQGNLLYRFFIDPKNGWVMHGAFQYLKDNKMGGMHDFEKYMQDTAHNHMYGTQINAERKSGVLKLGYVFPGNKYRSLGLQVSGVNQSYDNYFGNNLYTGNENSFYANLIFQDVLWSVNHRIRVGFSNQSDWVEEHLFNKQSYSFNRKELVNGLFGEYTYTYLALFTAVAGFRVDHHNYFGWKFIPRIHLRYAPNVNLVYRAVLGKAWRSANLISENMSLLASSRTFVFSEVLNRNSVYGYRPEEAWNAGVNVTYDFKINLRKGTIGLDYYYTFFEKQVVIDREANTHQVVFYPLSGKSYSRSLQFQLDYQPIKRFDIRFAYRWYDVKMQYRSSLLEVPMIASHRWFLNASYATRNKWGVDLTLNRIGSKRLPQTMDNPENLQLASRSIPYILVNMQLSKKIKNRLDVYAGCENIFNFQQKNAILDGGNPFGQYFDAAMSWGPVFGRMFYSGLRFKL